MAEALANTRVRDELGQLEVPALILHAPAYRRLELAESVDLASRLPNAQLRTLSGSTFLGDAATGVAFTEEFVRGLPNPLVNDAETQGGHAVVNGLPVSLSSRELDVLRLVAEGKTNAQIAEALVISPNTVLRHVSNVLAKTGSANRTEAAIFAHRHELL